MLNPNPGRLLEKGSLSIKIGATNFMLLFGTNCVGKSETILPKITTIHCKKRLSIFPSPAGMSLAKLSLAGNNLIIPGWGREIAKLFYSVTQTKDKGNENVPSGIKVKERKQGGEDKR